MWYFVLKLVRVVYVQGLTGTKSPWYVVLMWIQTVRNFDMGGGRGGGQGPQTCPCTITSCHLFPRRKKWYELPSKSNPPSPLELSGSAHACPTVEFYFLFVAGLAIILSRAKQLPGCAVWSAPLLFNATATRYIRNGVNKANPDKTSRSPQSCSTAKLCGIKF